jgi:hypothetical protein
MAIDCANSQPTTLEVLVDEIEATPKEYWPELLDRMRQFRETIPLGLLTTIDTERLEKNRAAIKLLDSWLGEDEDAEEHQQAWNFLQTALYEDRLSDRPLFP